MKKTQDAKVTRATNEGRIYIRTSDFFRQEKVKTQINDLMNSSIYKKIEEKRNK